MEVPALVSVSVLGACALGGAWSDIRERKLPNLLVLATLVCGLTLATLSGGLSSLGSHLGHFAIALAIGFGLFGLKFWGGGDGKFYGAVAAWFPFAEFFQLVFAISLVGLVLVVAMIVRKRGKAFARQAASVPYGVAIGLGALVTLAQDVWWQV